MSEQPHRGTCPVCGQVLRCDEQAKILAHVSPRHEVIIWCPGSRQVCREILSTTETTENK